MSAQAPGGKSWANRTPVGDWALDAACYAHHHPDWWFPVELNDRARPYSRRRWSPDTQHAINMCNSCDVREQCLEYALQHDERDGIWGGKTPRERAKLTGRHANSRTYPMSEMDHGTAAGAVRHRLRGESPCESCLAAERQAKRERVARARQAV